MWVEDIDGDLINLDKCSQLVVIEVEQTEENGETHALVADERVLNSVERHWLATGNEDDVRNQLYHLRSVLNAQNR